MSELQDWLSIRPDPKTIKAFICDALRNFTADEQEPAAPPPLIRRGIERC